uniref:Uncharacterized protein n=1 Tax=uncultured bacterium BLR5 TaxID=506522 RepID=C0INV2_9BACT|nr:hypothetical protein AKSOIL_0025 [uncultured bacterium BLR5]
MIVKRTFQVLILVFAFVGGLLLASGQSRNLLQNPNANLGSEFWRVFGEATVEPATGNNLCFVVRNGGYFLQDVPVSDDAVGQYAVLIGRGASERINHDGAITGLPYLYGYMMEQGPPTGGIVLAYLQGQRMLADTKVKDEWVDMWGVFQVPERTKRIRFFLNQASRRGVPQNGSAARFDNLGLYLFVTKEEAEAFVSQYH